MGIACLVLQWLGRGKRLERRKGIGDAPREGRDEASKGENDGRYKKRSKRVELRM